MSARERHKKQVEANAAETKKQEEARPFDGLGFFVARQTSVVYHPISSSKDWDFDARNRVYDPSRDRARIEEVIEDNRLYLRHLGKQHRKEDRRRLVVAKGL